jgi:hypothetical protein
MRVLECKIFKPKTLRLFGLSMGFLLTQTLLGCANKASPRERMEQRNANARPHPAAWSTESFYLHHRSPPEKEAEKWEFYFKHCRLVQRNPFPTHDEYTCSEPY